MKNLLKVEFKKKKKVGGQLSKTLPPKQRKTKSAEDTAHLVEHLPRMHKSLSSVCSTNQEKKLK
jgi:hypothetical protein